MGIEGSIAAMAVINKQYQLQQAVSTKVLGMVMDSSESTAGQLLQGLDSSVLGTMVSEASKAMELSVNPHLGSLVDVYA